MTNGIFGGFAAICSRCSMVPVWAAFVIRLIARSVYISSSRLQLYVMKIDDRVNAAPVHLWCGIWGCSLTTNFMQRRTQCTSQTVTTHLWPAMESSWACRSSRRSSCSRVLSWHRASTLKASSSFAFFGWTRGRKRSEWTLRTTEAIRITSRNQRRMPTDTFES